MRKLFAVAIFLLAPSLFAVPKDWKPVPASQLNGRTFTSADGLFAVDLPSDDYAWYVLPLGQDTGSVMLIAFRPAGGSFTVVENFNCEKESHGEAFVKNAEAPTAKSAAEHDGVITNYRYDSINLPVPNTWRYRYTITEEHKVMHRFVYVVDSSDKSHRVFLQTSSDTPKEPRIFARFVVSFRWLH